MVGYEETGIEEEGERVISGDKGRSEIGKVVGMAADVPTMDSLGKRYEAFGGWGMVADKVEVLLVVSGLYFYFCVT